jgi:hypothetical protein
VRAAGCSLQGFHDGLLCKAAGHGSEFFSTPMFYGDSLFLARLLAFHSVAFDLYSISRAGCQQIQTAF